MNLGKLDTMLKQLEANRPKAAEMPAYRVQYVDADGRDAGGYRWDPKTGDRTETPATGEMTDGFMLKVNGKAPYGMPRCQYQPESVPAEPEIVPVPPPEEPAVDDSWLEGSVNT